MAAYTTIDDPSAHFHTQLYTGTGSALSITNDANAGDFQPDFIWIKSRSNATNNNVYDSQRGQTKRLYPNLASDPEDTVSGFTLNTDGFSTGTSSIGDINVSTETYVAWQWKANGGTSTGSAAESGDNPAYNHQANTTAGFSIVTYTGTGANGTVSHGLGAVPHIIIAKSRASGTRYWAVYNIGLNFPTDDLVYLDADSAANQHDPTWNNTAPTSSVFTVGTYDSTNADGESFVAYLWTPIKGFSKFGKYTGNANADGSFIYTGFKPAWIMIKRTDGSNNWNIFDNKRDVDNIVGNVLYADIAQEEGADAAHSSANDFLSNGFKLRETGNAVNGSGAIYVYMAFAESPFVTSGGVPCTAR